MPIIAKHHLPGHLLSTDVDYTPIRPWHDDTYVQWGGHGLVLSENSYTTAFFEAFPKSGGFIRGEGATLEEAEEDAFKIFEREHACTHAWGRRGYLNGAAKCVKCGSFKSQHFHEVALLGEWRKPLCSMQINSIMSGWLRDRENRPKERADAIAKQNRTTWLRARQQGIKLPPIPNTPMTDAQFLEKEIDAYTQDCRLAVIEWLASPRCEADEATRRMTQMTIDSNKRQDERRAARAALTQAAQ